MKLGNSLPSAAVTQYLLGYHHGPGAHPQGSTSGAGAGCFSLFSNSMQAKGYLQNYAQFLNLDKDAVLVQFAEALQLHRLESTKLPRKSQPEAKVLSPISVAIKSSLRLIIFGSFLILGMWAF